MHSEDEPDVHLLARIAATEQSIRSNINLIPINNWGFSDDIIEKLKQRKHSMVNQRLTPGYGLAVADDTLFLEERAKLSNAAKQRLARGMKGHCRTVSDVFDWLANAHINTKPSRNTSRNINNTNCPETSGAVQKSPMAPHPTGNKKTEDEKKSGSLDSSGECMETDENRDARVATDNDEISEQADSSSPSKVGSGSLSKPRSKGRAERKAAMKRKHANDQSKAKREDYPSNAGTLPAVSASESEKKMLIVDPLESRRLALKRLQARIQLLRSVRKGAKSAQQYEEQRKLRRRVSVMKRKAKKRAAKQASQGNTHAKQPRNDAGQLVYSKFDFIVKGDQQKEKKKDKRDKFAGKDYGRLLKKAEKRQERIESIREKDAEKAEHIEENIRWNRAMNRAEGQKVKDNPELLRKSVNRKEKIKERRKQKWAKRIEYVEEKKAKKQDKRNANIQARKDAVKKRKLDKAKRKGRIL
ncbi:unnamed protein product [Toxocara canis]|uniref:SURF6 domain-containing protein n=1 Tax=Toxocara canis TaxID=6265 RepID=A0A183UBW5_TOXCA|nr:unnamed protein product [Toxocara canis]